MANAEVGDSVKMRYSLTVLFKDGTNTVIRPLSVEQVEFAYKQFNFGQTAFRVQPMESYKLYIINPSEVNYLAMEPL